MGRVGRCCGFFVSLILVCVGTARAYTQWEWKADGIVETDFYTIVVAGPTTTFSTREAAYAAVPRVAAYQQVLTEFAGARSGRNGRIEYVWVAPHVEINLGPWKNYTLGFSCPAFATEAEALNCYQAFVRAQSQECANATIPPPASYTLNPVVNTREYASGATQVVGAPDCGLSGDVYVTRERDISCPAGYDLRSNSQGYCLNPYAASVSVGPMECPSANSPSPIRGNPCNAATGDKSQSETDYEAPGIVFSRHYHSAISSSDASFGFGWSHSYSSKILFSGGDPFVLIRPDGYQEELYVGTVIRSRSGSGIRVSHVGTEWQARLSNGDTEVYSATGALQRIVNTSGLATTLYYAADPISSRQQLVSVVGPFGHRADLTYVNGRVDSVATSDGGTIHYQYGSAANLTQVVFQDGTQRQYLYENASFPNHLTGIIDEQGVRFATYAYDSIGRAITSEHAGGAGRISIVYNTTSSVVTESAGSQTTFSFTNDAATPRRIVGLNQSGLTENFTLGPDSQRRVTQHIDRNGNITKFAYDDDHLVDVTEAFGTPRERTTTRSFLSVEDDLPTLERLTTPTGGTFRETNITYDSLRRPTVSTTTASDGVGGTQSRTTTTSYTAIGQVETIDGPRTDVNDKTTFSYYACDTGYECGQLHTVSNALGHVTTFNSYNAHGQATRTTDANGLATSLAYDARQRLTDRCSGGTLPGCAGGELTHLDYWPTGLLKKVTSPDGSTLQYTYDDAHRLTEIQDGAFNKVVYTLDAMGNRTAENAYDPSNALKRAHSRVFNTLNQLWKDVNAAGTANVTTLFGYDSNGNPTTTNAPLARNSTNAYDELNRLIAATDPNSGVTRFAYDANDNLTSVTDPLGLVTTYSPNGFGDTSALTSPDTGVTTNTYDSAGNLKTSLDARGALTTNAYDALNRLTQALFTGGPFPVTRNYGYDSCLNGKGRLCQMTDPAGTTSWTYDTRGRVLTKAQQFNYTEISSSIIYLTQYAYNGAGQLSSMTYPSGMVVNYSYSKGQISGLTATIAGVTQTVVSSVGYEPFGSIKSWTWGNGAAATRVFDTDGRITSIASPGLARTYQYDDGSRIVGTTDQLNASLSWSYGYDSLDRLTSQAKTGTSITYAYDENGNRISQSGSVYGTPNTFVFDMPRTSNRLQKVTGIASSPSGPYTFDVSSYSYDASGNGIQLPYTNQYFDASGRFASRGGNRLLINGLGQRVRRDYAGAERHWVYDESGHTLGQYDYYLNYLPSSYNTVPTETIWLGDLPIAVVHQEFTRQSDPDGDYVTGLTAPALLYAQVDHLGSPRALTRPSDNTVAWRWDSDAFGKGEANGALEFSQRFPGQIADPDTSTYYNYLRDYDPAVGRYTESDSIGLRGGINTYGYARMRPGQLIDMFGLSAADVTNVVSHVNDNFPEIHTNGGWEFGTPDSGASAHSNSSTGRITIDQIYKKECLTEDEFYSLYFDYLHEAMHSTDPSGTRKWDAFMQNSFGTITSNHQSIYNRAEYEELGVFPKGFEKDGLWGYGPTSNIRQPISPKVKKLYEETRSCECKK